ncbi:hypothetical protein FVE85_5988 [Porphyridium purpureum]|uniref:Uncharacterized protein n=1 Tax=Porphyridium purpureum TaxID=35688 RepID=A0A5J4Z6E7_PORPP|nr:hypothetical protein FVE85_5988 [Porphyridium purpureum]|eukprot:POR3890..scf295_1
MLVRVHVVRPANTARLHGYRGQYRMCTAEKGQKWRPGFVSLEYAGVYPRNAHLAEKLMTDGSVQACIEPDLPLVSSWRRLLQQAFKAGVVPQTQASPLGTLRNLKASQKVFSVAAQTRSEASIRRKIHHAVNENGGARALLFVSGSSVLRKSPFMEYLSMDSVAMIGLAARMRAAGEIPAHVEFWAVANPNVPSTKRNLELELVKIEEKIEAGATHVVTQPFLHLSHATQFWKAARKRGLLERCDWHIGMGIFPTPAAYTFWLYLSGIQADAETRAHTQHIQQCLEQDGNTTAQVARLQWIRSLQFLTDTLEVHQTERVCGLHVMPLRAHAFVPDLIHLARETQTKVSRSDAQREDSDHCVGFR